MQNVDKFYITKTFYYMKYSLFPCRLMINWNRVNQSESSKLKKMILDW